MKLLTIALSIVAVILGALWYAIGGAALAISFGALVLIVVIFGAFGFGSWWTANVMERGARIALASQASDDKRDIAQFNGVSGLVRDLLKLSKEQAQLMPPEYPALPAPQGNGNTIDGEFRIRGFDE